MTYRKKLAIEHPEMINTKCERAGGIVGCPHHYGYTEYDESHCLSVDCVECWNREIPEENELRFNYTGEPIAKVESVKEENDGVTICLKHYTDGAEHIVRGKRAEIDVLDECSNYDIPIIPPLAKPTLKDSGQRRDFGTGAVRDMGAGKGRCDLMPLDVVADVAGDRVYSDLNKFLESGDELNLITALAAAAIFSDFETMFLEVAKHFEEGCKKYGENNWRKGIPVKFYIDSAVRHYLKYRRGDKDEPHDRAFCWNILCAIWTYRHLPEMRGTIGNEQNKNEQDRHTDD